MIWNWLSYCLGWVDTSPTRDLFSFLCCQVAGRSEFPSTKLSKIDSMFHLSLQFYHSVRALVSTHCHIIWDCPSGWIFFHYGQRCWCWTCFATRKWLEVTRSDPNIPMWSIHIYPFSFVIKPGRRLLWTWLRRTFLSRTLCDHLWGSAWRILK